MIVRAESWSRPARSGRRRSRHPSSGRRRQVGAFETALAVAVFLLSWALLHEGFYAREQIVDTPIYERYGEAMTRGEVPYRDFPVEYPPAALPVFVIPAVGDGDSDDYRRRFEGLMAGLGVATLLALAAAAAPFWALLFVAVAPLLLGSVYLSRFDLWPAALTAGALALLVAGRHRFGLGVLGIAAAAKLYPAVIAPVAFAHVWKVRGRREALVCAAVFLGLVAAIVLPFAAVSPGGVWDAVSRQAGRPLQIESLGAGILLTADHVFGLDLTMESSHGSQNLAGTGADVVAAASTVLQIVALAAVWIWFARGTPSRERLVAASVAAVCAFVAFGKVLSPQFLIWLVPLVPLVGARRGMLASALLATALVLTQLWFPYRYWDLALEFDAVASWLVLARDVVLVALLGVLLSRARPAPSRSA